MKKKKGKLKIQNIIICLNIVILLAITCFYAYRLIHFYRIENPKTTKKLNLIETITLKKNITTIEDGLYKEDDGYIFKGNKVNNYLKYSGYLFRIVSIDKDNNIKLITDESLTNLVWGIDDYKTSYVKNWLNNTSNGVFYKSLNNPDNYLVDTNFCIDTLDSNDIKCKEIQNDSVGLLSLIEYKNAGGSKSYLNKNNYWWLSNTSSEGVWFVYNDGKLNDVSSLGKEYYSYGVRPVITIKGDIDLISGEGTLEKPYVIEQESSNLLKDKNIGSYVNYSNNNWRIIEKNDSYIRLALDGVIKQNDEDYERSFSNNSNVYSINSAIGYYLNNNFYETLDHTNMVTGTIYTNRYDSTVDFDYSKIFDNKIEAKVGMMQVGDLFINDYSDYFLVSRTSTYIGTIYKVEKDNNLYADLPSNKAKIRPTIFLDLSSQVKSGNGEKENPYIIG